MTAADRRRLRVSRRAEERRDQGRYREAKPLLRQALDLAERLYGADAEEIANQLNSVGILYKCMGRCGEAERLYRRALGILKRTLGPAHPDIASLYHNLGGLEHSRGRHARGERLARHSVAIRQEGPGPDHPDVAADIAALAALLDSQGKHEESEPPSAAHWRPSTNWTVPNTTTLRSTEQSRGRALRTRQLRRGGPALPARAVDERKAAGARPPGHRHDPQQLRGALEIAGPAAQGGGVLPPRAGHLRESARSRAPHLVACRENYEALLTPPKPRAGRAPARGKRR